MGSTLGRQIQQLPSCSPLHSYGLGHCPAHLPALSSKHKGATFKELALSLLPGKNARPEDRTVPLFLITHLANSTSDFNLTSNAISCYLNLSSALRQALHLLCSYHFIFIAFSSNFFQCNQLVVVSLFARMPASLLAMVSQS